MARPEGMEDEEFLARAAQVTKWFDSLSPYDDDYPLFKIEDQNYRLKNGQLLSGVYEPLYALAISAKRYVLFNLDANGRPIIRKALSHGLGHLLAPYQDHEAPQQIPPPTLKASDVGRPLKSTDIGVDRWQYDVWYQIITAELEGHPDQVDYSILNHPHRKAASRYGASTSTLLRWFGAFNKGKPHTQQVKAFNFMLAYQLSRPAYYEAVANGKIDLDLFDGGLPAVVAPYDKDPETALAKCFDRYTGRPVPKVALASYREVLADYYLHSEAKFENGELFNRGITQRRHIQVVDIEYIGKEANRWEEQYFLGEVPEAQIEYGRKLAGNARLNSILKNAVDEFGIGAVANEARLSRQQLHSILAEGAMPRRGTVARLCRAVMVLRQQMQIVRRPCLRSST